MKKDFLEYLEEQGVLNEEKDYLYCNDEGITFEEILCKWAAINNYSYDITSDHVFESPGEDIYCYAFAYINDEQQLISELFVIYCN
jgi:hypothetical protein